MAACAGGPVQQSRPAPVVELPTGPSNAPQLASETKAESKTAVPATTSPELASGAYLAGDGPGAVAPANLDNVADAVPKAEPLHRYANRPYTALGKTYTPLEATGNYKEMGIASWYGKKFHGLRTSIGEVYNMYGMTAAHPILPIPSYARVTNLATKKSVIVRVNDRGPFLHDRIVDLSYTAAFKLGVIAKGSAEVLVESIAVDGSEPLTPAEVSSEPIPLAPVSAESLPPVVVVPEVQKPALTLATNDKPPVAGNVYLQLGAFKSTQGAESFLAKMQSTLGDVGKSLSLNQKDGFERVHLGPYATADEARAASEKLKERLGFKPFVSVR
jgi:rare lipoprotein A